MCSACRLMVFNVCVKFHENMSSGFKVMERTQKIVNIQRAITPKVETPELRYMCSARRLMVFNVCLKFHENMLRGFKVMERTGKLLTDTHTHTHTHKHTQKRRNHYTPIAYFVCRGYKKGNLQLCLIYRTISLISQPSKIMLKVILNRLKPQAEEIIAQEQAGFRAGRSTTEQIFNISRICTMSP